MKKQTQAVNLTPKQQVVIYPPLESYVDQSHKFVVGAQSHFLFITLTLVFQCQLTL